MIFRVKDLPAMSKDMQRVMMTLCSIHYTGCSSSLCVRFLTEYGLQSDLHFQKLPRTLLQQFDCTNCQKYKGMSYTLQ